MEKVEVVYQLIVTFCALMLGIWGLSSNDQDIQATAIFSIIMGIGFAIGTLVNYLKINKKEKS